MLQYDPFPVDLGPTMDFGAVPPEMHSRRMHSGPGAQSMMDAATAWDVLGVQLGDLARNYRAVFGELTEPSASAHADYLDWLDATAEQARQTAVQATAAAGAYGSTFAAVVVPRVIEANRLQRDWLATTNCLAQISPAIADVEAAYERMWAQNAGAMYAYARAAAATRKLTPFSSPPPIRLREHARNGASVTEPSRKWRLMVAPEVIMTGRQVISTIAEALDTLSTSKLDTFDVSLLPTAAPLSRLSSLSAPLDVALSHLNSLNKAAALNRATVVGPRRPTGDRTVAAGPRASVGCAAAIGALSVPRAWTRSTPAPARPSPQADPVDRTQ